MLHLKDLIFLLPANWNLMGSHLFIINGWLSIGWWTKSLFRKWLGMTKHSFRPRCFGYQEEINSVTIQQQTKREKVLTRDDLCWSEKDALMHERPHCQGTMLWWCPPMVIISVYTGQHEIQQHTWNFRWVWKGFPKPFGGNVPPNLSCVSTPDRVLRPLARPYMMTPNAHTSTWTR